MIVANQLKALERVGAVVEYLQMTTKNAYCTTRNEIVTTATTERYYVIFSKFYSLKRFLRIQKNDRKFIYHQSLWFYIIKILSCFSQSIYRDITLEKHWKALIYRSVCDYFFEAQKRAYTPEDVPVVISTPNHYLISIYRKALFFVAVVNTEVPPLLVIEFLHRVVDIFIGYFDDCNDTIIKENLVTIYELLDEMLDNGYPLATESNILQELIKPPNFFRNLANTVTGKSNVSETLPMGQLSNIPWRRSGVRYTNNEAYFDVVEEIDAIVDKSGNAIFAEIQGYVDCCIKLSGMPDLTMAFSNPRLFDDVSFHPCVRFKRWEHNMSTVWLVCFIIQTDRVLSFVPPDGQFRLMSFHIGSQSLVTLPINLRHSFTFKNTQGGKLDLTVSPKHNIGKMLEDVSVTVVMPKFVVNCNLVPTQGKYTFDTVTKVLLWEIGKVEYTRLPNLQGTVTVQPCATSTDGSPTINVHFLINQLTVSGIKVNRVDMYGEKYKPFKGVKYITKAGRFQVRI
ncbi:AP-3 complex subunit mu-1 [Trichinella murrelli]|uniref:AP-3 complex subunit mu-1 n=1 Tax=Trichinella murrelli TaxID=144512 RepID=A0A0V0UCD5_9BILA|nr:AP-3 complex subunit mu-1 [Trichinella murrelli]